MKHQRNEIGRLQDSKDGAARTLNNHKEIKELWQ